MKNHKLTFEKTITDLAGNRLGRDTYNSQIKNQFDENDVNVVIIPSVINDIGTSFIQGIYFDVRNKFGSTEALKKMELKSENIDTQEKIDKAIRVYGI